MERVEDEFIESYQLKESSMFLEDAETLIDILKSKVGKFEKENTYYYSEDSAIGIIKRGIDYFDQLEDDFLGETRCSGDIDMKADHFANNLYRVFNAMKYLSNLWKVEFNMSKECDDLLDIRTVIVHSGEQISNVLSANINEISGYKDIQLDKISSKKHPDQCEKTFGIFEDAFSRADYCIRISCDKHDKSKKNRSVIADYDRQKGNYRKICIYIKATDVRDIVLTSIKGFLEGCQPPEESIKAQQFPVNKEKWVEKGNIDFDRIAKYIKNNRRGRYLVENGIEYWNGFGLSRLSKYIEDSIYIFDEVKEIINEEIYQAVSKYWDQYNDKDISDDDMPYLDIGTIFKEYTPKYDKKYYFEGEKLFNNIAPFFNTYDREGPTDIDYLERFICEINNALGIEMNLEQSVSDLVCDYYVQSIKKHCSQ